MAWFCEVECVCGSEIVHIGLPLPTEARLVAGGHTGECARCILEAAITKWTSDWGVTRRTRIPIENVRTLDAEDKRFERLLGETRAEIRSRWCRREDADAVSYETAEVL